MDALNLREGVIWATRLLLDREPTETDIALLTAGCSVDTIRRVFVDSAEYKSWLAAERANRIPPAMEIDRHEGLKWAFRLLLDRELDDATAELMKDGVKTVSDIRDTVIYSNEFRLRAEPKFVDLISYATINRFAPFASERAAAGSFRDFIGTTTRCSFLPPEYLVLSGTVQDPPMAPNYAPVLHEASEWVPTLRSIIEAKDRLIVLELGAGWAPWLVAAAKAAEKRGIRDLELVGVEGSLDHVGFMKQHFRDNGLDPDAHRLIHGVVGTADGVAHFPKLADPQINYCAEACFDGPEAEDTEEVRCFSLETLLPSLQVVDLIHCDIQGAEGVVLPAAREIVGSRVRRIVIGTHSRRIEDGLMDLFSELGWWLEHESACRRVQRNSGKVTLYEDGTQVWRNPTL